MQLRATVWAVGLVVAAGGCSSSGIWHAQAQYPPGERQWEVPLLDPLTRSNPYVWAEIRGPEGEEGRRTYETNMLIDSGAWGSALPRDMLRWLRVALEDRSRVKTVDARGTVRKWEGAFVPEVRLGTLVLREMSVSSSAGVAVLGRDMLDAHAWEIDLDRGVMILGSERWRDPAVVDVELGKRRYLDYVELALGPHEVLLYVDTGASATAIDLTTARDLALAERDLAEPRKMVAMHGTFEANSVFDVPVAQLERAEVADLSLVPLPKHREGGTLNRKVVGLLGMDFLRQFRFRLDAHRELQLQSRRSVLESSTERIARWSWVPRCEGRPGCATAEIVRFADAADVGVSVRLEADYDRAARFVFGCVTTSGSIDQAVPYLEYAAKQGRAGSEQKYLLQADDPFEPAREWVASEAERCDSLALIDVNPVKVWSDDEEEHRLDFVVDARARRIE